MRILMLNKNIGRNREVLSRDSWIMKPVVFLKNSDAN